ncbi:hypothetical protein TNCV_4119571 [Trichonephila clavipes]|nr:hypothetical protein TNCV_4119571 [Trichonephila clavipes]
MFPSHLFHDRSLSFRSGSKHSMNYSIVIFYIESTEEDMSLRRYRRQQKQLSEFQRGRIIRMMEAVWSAQRVARQVVHSDLTVSRCCDQWTKETSFTRRQAQEALNRPVVYKIVTSCDTQT